MFDKRYNPNKDRFFCGEDREKIEKHRRTSWEKE